MIDILLATYNGGRFVKEQLDSLLQQTQEGVSVLVQDDGSGDETPAILKAYTDEFPEIIRIVKGPDHEKSPKGNFLSLLAVSQNDYVMFCDQDDVWNSGKCADTFARMKEGEALYGSETPLLVHTDLMVTDEHLQEIAPSFWRYQKLDQNPPIRRLLAQNSITGCATMINRPLKELLLRAPAQDMLMHDWWAALCAASMGHILTVDKPAIRYRQHGGNQLGATGFNPGRDVKKAAGNSSDVRKRLADTFRQADTFFKSYQSLLPDHTARIIKRYASLSQRTKIARMYDMVRFGYTKKGFLRVLGQLYYC